MSTKARIQDGAVVELLTADPFPPFHESLIWVDCDDTVSVGDLYDGTSFSAVMPALADIQAAQIALLDGEYATAVQNSVSFTTAEGVTKMYQADNAGPLSSQSVLLKAFTGFNILGVTPSGFAWTAADNVDVPFTLADLAGLYGAMLTQGNNAFSIRKGLKAQVRAIKVKSGVTLTQAIAAVQAITWP